MNAPTECQCVWPTPHEGEVHYGRFLVDGKPEGGTHYRCDGHIYEFLIADPDHRNFEHLSDGVREEPWDSEEFSDESFNQIKEDVNGKG
jgi:hypothetical protein